MLISFEGGDGAGKSTQINRLKAALDQAGIDPLVTREPGGTAAGSALRDLLLNRPDLNWHGKAEALLFFADRQQHVEDIIKPALKAGKTIICDRFTDSTAAYQASRLGQSMDFILELHRLVLGDFWPDLTILLDIDPEIAEARLGARQDHHRDRIEAAPLAQKQALRQNFLTLADKFPNRIKRVDASGSEDQIHQQIWAIIAPKLGLNNTQKSGPKVSL